MADGTGTLQIHRHRAVFRIPVGCQDGHLASRLDDTLRERLPRSLASAVGDFESEDGIWIIRNVRLYVRVGSSWTSDQIADHFAKRLASVLHKTLGLGADAADVLWFPTRAAYLGRFLSDCAEGRAEGRWEYGQFRRLFRLTPSAILREAVLGEPKVAREALVNVLPGELRAILRQLAPRDAVVVLDSLSEGLAVGSFDQAFRAVAAAVGEIGFAADLPRDPALAGLSLFLHVLREGQLGASGALIRMAKEMAALAVLLRGRPTADTEKVAAALLSGDMTVLRDMVGSSSLVQIAAVLAWPRERRRDALIALAKSQTHLFEEAGPVPVERMSTRLGGMFLLLPLLEEFPWSEATAGWPSMEDVPAARLMQYLTMIGAFGRKRNVVAASDAILRLALGIDSRVSGAAVAAWAGGISQRNLRHFRAVWLEHLYSRGKAMGSGSAVVRCAGMTISIDPARGLWVRCDRRRPGAPGDASPRLREESEYVALDPAFQITPGLRRLTMMTSQALLREFGWRLPGFSQSSLPYLFANFLDFGAAVQPEDDRYVVSLNKPPLHLVLTITGMCTKRFRLDATEGKEWLLTQAQ